MNKYFLIVATLLVALTTFGQASAQNTSSVQDLSKPRGNEPPILGIHWARGFDPYFLARSSKAAGGKRSPNMLYHNGKIIPAAITADIFWGKSWGSYSGDKISGLDNWYIGFSNSNYAKTSDEYKGTNGQVGPTLKHLGSIIDPTAASGGNSTSAILAEVCAGDSQPRSGRQRLLCGLYRFAARQCQLLRLAQQR